MSERKYFSINESSARSAHDMMSMRDYSEGSTTAEYRSAVDKAYDIADRVAEKKSRRRQRGRTGSQRGIPRKWRNTTTKRAA